MRCKTCDYPLWQIRDRKCPECGTEFRPSEFEFVLNSVRFCCPRCSQAYYGTGTKGHLVPSEFDCVTCSRHISMDEMVLLPTEGVREDQTKVEVNPWLERRRIGLVKGWFSTIIQSMGAPGRLIRATPEQSSLGQAVWYAALTNGVFLLGGLSLLLALFVVVGIITAFAGNGGAGGGIMGIMAPATAFIVWAIVMIVAMIVGAFVWGALAHGLLRLTGPTSAGISRTMQCMLYSSGTNVANAIPCLGIYVGWISSIWWIVSATLMLKEGQRVSGGRAALAAVLPAAVGVVLVVGLLVFAIVMPVTTTIATAQAAAAQAQATQAVARNDAARIAQLAVAIKTHAEEYGSPPVHAAELIDTQRVWVSNFLTPDGNQTARLDEAKIATMTLSQIGMANGDTTDAVIAAANASLPENVIAHRIGDTVFCYHGIDFATADPELWTVISSPELGATTQEEVTIGIVGTSDGTNIHTFPTGMLSSMLATQNTMRAAAGLPPLPDPSAVTADQPAVAE